MKSDSRKWNGVEVTGVPNIGDVPTATSDSEAEWAAPTDLSAAVILAPTTAARNTIVPTGTATSCLTLKEGGGMTGSSLALRIQDSGGATNGSWTPDGKIVASSISTNINAGNAVTGISSAATGVRGKSTSSYGVDAESFSGASIRAKSDDLAPGSATVEVHQGAVTDEPLMVTKDDSGALIDTIIDKDGHLVAPGGGGVGTVTSVALTVPSEFSVSGSPITSSGTLAVTKATQSANRVFAGPTSGSAAQPTFRALVSADIPNNAADTTGTASNVTGIVDETNGGTGVSSYSKGDILVATGVTTLAKLTVGTDGDVLTADSGATEGVAWAAPGAGGFVPDKAILMHTDGTWDVYTTLAAAKAASVSGETIVVGPGAYTDKDILKDGVNWWFAPGAVVTHDGTASTYIFDDHSATVVCTIGGHGTFKFPAGGTGFAWVGGTNSIVTINADTFELTGNGSTYGARAQGGIIHLNLNHWIGNFTTSELLSSYQGKIVANIGYLDTYATKMTNATSNVTIVVNIGYMDGGGGVFTNASSGYQYVRIGKLATVASASNTSSGRQVFIVDSFQDISQGTFFGTIASNTGSGFQDVTLGGYVNASTSSSIFLNSGSGTQTIDAKVVTNAAAGTIADCSAGVQIVRAMELRTSSASGYAVSGSGGTQRIINCRLVNTGTNGIAANAGGQTLIFEGTNALISHSGATDSLTAGSAQNVKNYGTLCGNKALNGNITLQVNTTSFFSDANVV